MLGDFIIGIIGKLMGYNQEKTKLTVIWFVFLSFSSLCLVKGDVSTEECVKHETNTRRTLTREPMRVISAQIRDQNSASPRSPPPAHLQVTAP